MMKNYIAAGIFCFFLPLLVSGQLQDDFSDGDLTNDPEWFGQADLFQVNAGELQLFDQEPETSNTTYLYVPAPTSTDENTVWEFFVRLEFSPSTSNFGLVYLAASDPDLTAPQNAYFVRIGGISGSDDALELYRQDGDVTDSELLISGTLGAVAADPAIARVRVSRTTDGNWTLEADYSGGTTYMNEGSAQDATYPMGEYFGFVCRYSSTRNESFFFDDVLVDPLFVDQVPPVLLSADGLDKNTVKVVFNEPLEEASAANPFNYDMSGGLGSPVEAVPDVDDPTQVILTFFGDMISGETYVLEANAVADLAGNAAGLQTAFFEFFDFQPAGEFEVLINEIMADPSPPVLLPPGEYLELYNRSDQFFNLENWSISDGGDPRFLPAFILDPGAYVILCDADFVAEFLPFGDVAGVPDFPGLNNGGDNLMLMNAEGQLVHQVNYSIEWYREADKDDGGWSLELINPFQPCVIDANWRASENLSGGTPGKENSVLETLPDEKGPELLSVFPSSTITLSLTFSEILDRQLATQPGQYLIDNGITVIGAFPNEESPNVVDLIIDPPLEERVVYELVVQESMTDCVGNPVNSTRNSFRFGLPEVPEAGDISINEVLFFPEVGGKDFVELYNRSEKIIDISTLVIANIQGSSDSVATVLEQRLFFPGEYLVFTESPNDILSRYTVLDPFQLVLNNLPILPSDFGNVTIYTQDGQGNIVIVETFDYSEDLHNELLDNDRGVSLERIDYLRPVEDASNWTSAAAVTGFATPTAPNSQALAFEPATSVFELPNKTFSPDGDGNADILTVNYSFDQPGYIANARIYDAQGRLIKNLISNELLPTEGSFTWDGDTGNGNRARIGIYIIWIEYFDPEGRVFQEKISCVLAAQF
jgi:hypothetical protein